ncbi:MULTISPECIES: HAD-IA family hydrolase [Pseudomonas]|jgi:putative hydrolase of the HAD superfamily|uniref:Putative hydrolase n=1 Tax=Pseudomonas brassicacearum (strain NFM421) TaxID=994484 RepID=F2K9X2_PSEBN|nr:MULTISPECIES: HAD-IA family hydrolase [Pseudomonas]AEA68263.1 putative hydrolase [Pseudomonas brassicacearum subsp. brassicacearum NFM421]UZE88571.1 HAD-IA family hydrolase [Pseudomonas viciae]
MKLTDFKVLTFDVVGTLINFEAGILAAVRSIGGPEAYNVSDDAIFDAYKTADDVYRGDMRAPNRFMYTMSDIYQKFAAELGLISDKAAGDRFQASVVSWPAFADSVDALARLRKHFRLVAMTNVDRTSFSAYQFTLGYPFHDSLTSEETGVHKPDPLYFAYNQGRQSASGFQKRDILHVAQSQYHDIGVAHEAGYTTCWIERRHDIPGYGATPVPEKVTQPDFHFHSMKELADAVEAELSNPAVKYS